MSIQALYADDVDEHLAHVRNQALTELSAAIHALDEAGAHITALRAVDLEFHQGRDGSDTATYIDTAIRAGRAAYAVVGTIIAQETP